MPTTEQYLTASQLAESLGVSDRTVRDWSLKDEIPYITLPSGHRRYLLTDVQTALSATPQEDDQ